VKEVIKISHQTIDIGHTDSPHTVEVKTPDLPSAFLLSVSDEYTIAHSDRGDSSEARDVERMISMGNVLTAVIILNGRLAGTWNKARKINSVEIRLNPFRKLNTDEQEALESEPAWYGGVVDCENGGYDETALLFW
jgi:hypothetical protein